MNYLFLDNGFEEIEAITTIDLLRRADIPVTTVSMTGSLSVIGAHRIVVQADALMEDTRFDDAVMLILPGGATHLEQHASLCNLLLKHNSEGKRIAAICAAPAVLGKLGILDGRQATCYPGFEQWLGESHVNQIVVQSENIITAKGPGLSSRFAFRIIEVLAGRDKAQQVFDAAQYQQLTK